jgi:hypothetical protein
MVFFFSLDEEPEDVSHRRLHLPQPPLLLLCCYLPSSTLTYVELKVELKGGGKESCDGARTGLPTESQEEKETRLVRLT